MSAEIEERIAKIPVINWLAAILKKIKLPGFEGLSVYDLIEMYILGIVEGALSTRASSIAFSLFLALFPLLIFMVTLVPFVLDTFSVQNTNFDSEFPKFIESFLPTATGDYFEGIFQQIKDQKRGGLLSSSFLLSIFLMANGVNSIFSGFETSYHVKLTRNFFKQYGYALMVGVNSVDSNHSRICGFYLLSVLCLRIFDRLCRSYRGLCIGKRRNHRRSNRQGLILYDSLLLYNGHSLLFWNEGRKASAVFFSRSPYDSAVVLIDVLFIRGVH